HLRPAGHRRANRGPLGLRAPGRRLLRAHRVESSAHPRGSSLLSLCAAIGAAAAAGEAAQAAGRGLARAGHTRLLSRSGGAAHHAHRADRRARAADRGVDLTSFEVGLGLQSDKSVEEYEALGRLAEDAGFDVISVFHDLFFQPAIFPLLAIARAT